MEKALEGKIPLAEELFLSKNDPNISPDRIRNANDINSIILHTTGWGKGHERVWRKYKQGKLTLKEFGSVYCEFQGRLQYNPHGTISPTGELYQFAPLKYRTHHTGSGKRYSYRNGSWLTRKTKPMKWWKDVYHTLPNPSHLPAWEGIKVGQRTIYSPNSRSVAWDLIPSGPNGKFTQEQYEKLAKVVAYCCHELNIPLDPKHILDHSRVHPLDRTNSRGPWDFSSKFDWNKFWDLLYLEYSTYRSPQDIPFKEKPINSIKVMLLDMGYYVDSVPEVFQVWTSQDEEALNLYKRNNSIEISPSQVDFTAVSKSYMSGHFNEKEI